MLQKFCDVSPDYQTLLRTLKDPLKLKSSGVIIQFPYTLPTAEEKTEEELARIAEKRKEQGRKLQELAAKTRLEKVRNSTDLQDKTNAPFKLVQKENDLQHLVTLREARSDEGKRDWAVRLSY